MTISNSNSTLSLASKVHVESIQTVVPIKPTDPINSGRISISSQNLDSRILGRLFHLILCYNKASGSDEDSGWLMAGWIKESLSIALCELPVLAGRLRVQESEDGDRNLHIVLNDSGVRLVEARVEMKLADFLDLEEKKEAEGGVVFWEDVIEHNQLQFSPLFYVQVTNFSCGGYSIGISCSLLLADPFALTAFLKRWANDHNTLLSKRDAPKTPICYLPKLRKLGSSKALLSGINTNKYPAQSVIFNIATKILNLDKNVYKNLAALCIDEAERKKGRKVGSKFSLFVKKPHEVLKVEMCSTECLDEKTFCTMNGLSCAGWDDVLGADETWFDEGNMPAYVSCWINSMSDEGSVMIIAADDEKSSAIQIIVTFPY